MCVAVVILATHQMNGTYAWRVFVVLGLREDFGTSGTLWLVLYGFKEHRFEATELQTRRKAAWRPVLVMRMTKVERKSNEALDNC